LADGLVGHFDARFDNSLDNNTHGSVWDIHEGSSF
jgi:hypothetical protein